VATDRRRSTMPSDGDTGRGGLEPTTFKDWQAEPKGVGWFNVQSDSPDDFYRLPRDRREW